VGDITLKKALGDYATIYMPYRNFAQRTREEYQNDLEDFIEFAEKSGVQRANDVGLSVVARYIAGLEHKGYSSLTRKRKVVTIRSFFSFLYSDGHVSTNIASKIVLPFTETTTPHILTQVECDRLRDVCADNPRDRAIIELLLQTGIRLSELTGLTLNDIDLDESGKAGEAQHGFIRILGNRGKRERIIPLENKATHALKVYLLVRENAENDVLFLNRFGEPVSDRGVQKMLRKYFKSAGIGNASIHTLRHTFGVYHLAQGTSLKALKEIMGHRDSRSTAVYRALAKNVNSNDFPKHIM
jgi:site-specific recombinase XerD